jgi:hypothetical protein
MVLAWLLLNLYGAPPQRFPKKESAGKGFDSPGARFVPIIDSEEKGDRS